MKRRRAQIPYEVVDRMIEHLKEEPQYKRIKKKAYQRVWLTNVSSYFNKPWHFDSIAEFTQYENQLHINRSHIALDNLRVLETTDQDDTIELKVSDESGIITLIHPYQPRTYSDGQRMPNDTFNNPIFGAQEDDVLKLFAGEYVRKGEIHLGHPLVISNNTHYARMKAIRNN